MRNVLRLFVIFLLALCPAFGQTQPIAFSHLTHVGTVKLSCEDCHLLPAKFGDNAGIPDAPKCLECHAFSVNKTSTLATLNYWSEKKQPIPWIRIFALKDFVFFDHRYHLQNGAKCEDCHGPISTEEVVSDKIGTTKMTTCQPCHVKSGAKTGCTTCHDAR